MPLLSKISNYWNNTENFLLPLWPMRFRNIYAIVLLLSCWISVDAQEVDTIPYFDPSEVFTVEEDSAEIARLAACKMVSGVWQYNKPYVHADGSSIVGKLGKPIAKNKLKKKLNKVFKKLKINKRWNSMALTADGAWEMRLLGVPLKGKYVYDPEKQNLTLKWKGIPLRSHTYRDGKKLYVAFDTDHLLVIMHVLSGLSHSETLKALSFLSQNFSNVMVGFEMKQQ